MRPATLVAAASEKAGSPLTFYSTAATLIVVLFLAVAYQTHYLRPVNPRSEQREDRERVIYQWVFAIVAMGVATVGEVKALGVLVDQHATGSDRHFVLSSLVLLGAAVASEPLLATLTRMPDDPRWAYRLVVGGWMGLVCVATILGLLNVNDVHL